MQACSVEHGNHLVKGQCGADGQRRTDDDCSDWLNTIAALIGQVRLLQSGVA